MKKKNSTIKAVRYTVGLFLALLTGLAPLALASPVPVKAAPNPVDLELGGEWTTPWYVTNIKPSSAGSTSVELRNVGTRDGFISIWVSDVINGEGENPEPETGDISEPGELGDYFLLDLSTENLSSNLDLPVSVNNMPQSATDSDYIEIIPLKAGESVLLEWQWELPFETGNVVQGDNLSFTVNYLLREIEITDVSAVVTTEGKFTANVTAKSDITNKGKLAIAAGTTGKTAANQSLKEIWIVEIDKQPLPAAPDSKNVGSNFETGPDGSTFDQPITITLSYDPEKIPESIGEGELFIALWDKTTKQWISLDNYTIDTVNKTISAQITHFSRYSVQAPLPPPPPSYEPGEGIIEYPPESPAEPAETGTLLEVDILDNESTVEIDAEGVVKEPFSIVDLDGNVLIDVKSGTRITGPEGEILSRIELTTTVRSMIVPDDTVILSPTYQLVGYTAEMEAVPVNFEPAAIITIGFDTEKLPENHFLPFIATYNDVDGVVRLSVSTASLIETGKAKALVNDEEIFFVAVELAPPPPPLPARFEASNLIINPEKTFTGETVTISVTIANKGETEGSYEVHLIVDGIVRTIEEVTLSAQSTETLTFEVSNLSAGTHQVKIADLSGEFEVVRMEVIIEETKFNWLLLDTIVGTILAMGAIALYLQISRARRARLAIEDAEEITFKNDQSDSSD
jgi:hypothetical protein